MQEYDVVTLKYATPTIPISPGTRGVVLILYPAHPPAYEVEFVDSKGESLGTYTVDEAQLELVSSYPG
jgi:uncharacterized protein DUF4926